MIGRVRAQLRVWVEAWSAGIPPHSYALLRIALGVMGLLSLAGLTPVDMFWPLDGLTPIPSSGPRAWIFAHGFGTEAGWAMFLGLILVFVAVTVGFFSNGAVLAAFIGLVAQDHWNHIPLSSAHQVMIVLLFCLIWADTGRVWSIDASRSKRSAADEPGTVPIWPLQLMRCQIAVIYLSSGLWKISYPMWRDGSAVHWALNLNAFHRFPWPVPVEWALFIAVLTWGTVLFELLFPVLVFFRVTRIPTLIAGIGLHIGLWATLELGPFSFLMIASYIAFLDPLRTQSGFLPKRTSRAVHPA